VSDRSINRLIERSSLGTRAAKAARQRVSTRKAEAIVRAAAERAAARAKRTSALTAINSRMSPRARFIRPVSGSTDPVEHLEKENTMAKGHHRSAVTGRYVKAATAARNPRTTVTEGGSGRNTGSGTHHRSAVTGRYVNGATAARHPNTTTTERG
jgi:hypothetical protein